MPLKLISPFLPDPFQFHGIWLLTCYVLQGFFGALLFSRFTSSRIVIFLGSLFFLLNPILVQRSGYHLALVSHWLILAGLYLYFGGFNKADKFKWAVLLAATAMVNFYLLIMLLIIWSGYLVKTWLENRNHSEILIFAPTAFFSLLITMWFVGYFVMNPRHAVSGGFGFFSMNLVSPFNPAPYDHFTFLKPVDLAVMGQYEGFSYMGFGALALLCFACYGWVKGKMKLNPVKFLPLMGASLVLTLLAVSNKVVFADTILFTLNLPEFFDRPFNVIRSSGRMFWPVTYLIILSSTLVLLNRYGSKKAALITSMTLALQVIDFYPWYSSVNLSRWEYSSPLKSPSWNEILHHTKQVNFVPPDRQGDEYIPFALLAANRGQFINVGYTGRVDATKRNLYRKQLMREFKSGHLNDETLYVIMDISLYRESYPSHKSGMLDGYLIVAPDIPIPDLEPWMPAFKDGEKNIISQVVKHYSELNHVILMSVKNEATSKLPGDFREFLKNKGGQIENLKYRGSYIAVINDGVLKHEILDNNQKVELTTSVGNYQINMTSAGLFFGNQSLIEINGTSLSPDQRGFNIVIVNPENGKALIYHYDTHGLGLQFKLPEKEITIQPLFPVIQ